MTTVVQLDVMARELTATARSAACSVWCSASGCTLTASVTLRRIEATAQAARLVHPARGTHDECSPRSPTPGRPRPSAFWTCESSSVSNRSIRRTGIRSRWRRTCVYSSVPCSRKRPSSCTVLFTDSIQDSARRAPRRWWVPRTKRWSWRPKNSSSTA